MNLCTCLKPNPRRKLRSDRWRRRWNVLENEISRFVPGLGGKTCSRIAGLYFNRLWLCLCAARFYWGSFLYLKNHFLATFNSKDLHLFWVILLFIINTGPYNLLDTNRLISWRKKNTILVFHVAANFQTLFCGSPSRPRCSRMKRWRTRLDMY